MASLGQELKKERELRGISLNEIADTTKINLRFFRALEEDHLEILPSKFFIKGIIRAHTEYLGLESEPYLNQYYQMEKMKEQAEEEEKIETSKPDVPKKVKRILFVFLVVIILAILTSIYFLMLKKEPPITKIQETLPPVLQQEIVVPPPQNVEPEMTPAPTPTQLDLLITFNEETWIQIFADGKLALDGLKYPGEVFETTAQEELIFYSGNAGGFTFFLNGRKGKPFGRLGDVARDIRITLQNMEQFIEEPVSEENAPRE